MKSSKSKAVTISDIIAAEERLKANGKPYTTLDIAKETGAKNYPELAETINNLKKGINQLMEIQSKKVVPIKEVVTKHKGWVNKEFGLEIDASDFFYNLPEEQKRLPIETNKEIIREQYLKYAVQEDDKNRNISKKQKHSVAGIPSLSEIFISNEAYKLCLEIMDHFEIKNISEKKAGILFAIIISFKEKCELYLKKSNYTDNFLLSVFNSYLGTGFKQIKKESDYYKSTKAQIKKLWFNR